MRDLMRKGKFEDEYTEVASLNPFVEVWTRNDFKYKRAEALEGFVKQNREESERFFYATSDKVLSEHPEEILDYYEPKWDFFPSSVVDDKSFRSLICTGGVSFPQTACSLKSCKS